MVADSRAFSSDLFLNRRLAVKLVAVADDLPVMAVHRVEEGRLLPFDELAHGDTALEADVDGARIHAVLDISVFLVILHGVEAIAELVPALV